MGWLIMAVMAIGAFLGGTALASVPGGVVVALIGGFLGGTILGVAMAKCLIRAKRLRAPGARELLARDHRPPVVYFRPFTADVDASKPVLPTSWFTEEEQLARMMNDIGPLVAIGAPDEKLPLLGAARMYVDNPKWHDAALDLVGRAAVIIMRIGNSPGFWWEFESVVRRIKPERLVLLVPRNQALYEAFRQASAKLIPTVLPGLTGWEVRKRLRGHLKSVIFFDKSWVPSVVDVQTYRIPWLRRSPAMPLVPVLKTALRPVYENAGGWTAPGINTRMVLVVAGIAFFVMTQVFAWAIEGMPGLPSFDSSPAPSSDVPTATAAPVEIKRSAVDIALERNSARLRQLPEFVSRVEAITASAGTGPDERERARQAARDLGAQLSSLGMKRLDDDALLAIASLRTKLIMQADVTGCAALSRGTARGRLMGMLESLEATEIDQYFELIYQATVAELRQSPAARTADPVRLQETMQIILRGLPEGERARLTSALTTGAGDNEEEACWAGRTLQAGIARLDRADRVLWTLAQ